MSNFCVVNYLSKVENIILADSKTIAESLTGKLWVESTNNFVDIGWNYNLNLNKFYPPVGPFESWILNDTTFDWEAPTPMPTDEKSYRWDEETVSWIEITE